MRHPAKIEVFQAQLIMKDPQAWGPSNPAVATKHLARIEWPFFCIEPIAPQDHSSTAFQTWDRQTDPFSLGKSLSATSSLSVDRALLGHIPTQVRYGSPWLSAF
jgi:hypothetical protein